MSPPVVPCHHNSAFTKSLTVWDPQPHFWEWTLKDQPVLASQTLLNRALGCPCEVCVCISVFMWERMCGWEGKESNTVLFCDAWSLTWVDYCIILFGYLYNAILRGGLINFFLWEVTAVGEQGDRTTASNISETGQALHNKRRKSDDYNGAVLTFATYTRYLSIVLILQFILSQ